MRITWYGHAAFLIETGGVRIILDPYRSPDSGGYEPVNDAADVVVVSHENDRYHSHVGQIIPPFEVIRALELPPGGREYLGILFEAVHAFENQAALDRSRFRQPPREEQVVTVPEPDEVAVVHFRAEGIHVVFLGDLGHPLNAEELAPLRGRRSSWPRPEVRRRSTSPTSPRSSTRSGRSSSSRCTTRRRGST